MNKSRVVSLFAAGMLLAGCSHTTVETIDPASVKASTNQMDWLKSMVVQGAGKTAVFCLQGDAATQKGLEAMVVETMHKQGFDAVEGHMQISKADAYSAEDLAQLLLASGFKSIAQVIYSGDVPKGGTPADLNFKMHTIIDPKTAQYSRRQTTLGNALGMFVQTLIDYGVSRI